MGLLWLCVLCAWILWVLYRDVKDRASVSSASWIVVCWLVIHGTRPVTGWLSGSDLGAASPESYDQGNPVDALVSASLTAAGLIVLSRRGVQAVAVIRNNRWLSVLYLFWAMSVIWSDYPLITSKRLFKDVGNIVMVLVVLTDQKSGDTMRAICVRLAYLCMPLSILLIRYYSSWGRTYTGFGRNELMFVGVTTHKNSLGVLAFVGALFLFWDLLVERRKARGMTNRVMVTWRVVVLIMCWYLLLTVDSVTSLVCGVVGSMVIVVFEVRSLARHPGRVEAYGLSTLMALWVLDSTLQVREGLVQSLGREMGLTSRVDVWPKLLQYQGDPAVGVGFNTFWAGRRLVELQENVASVIQAHNGYLETYLNGGWVAIGLLVIVLCAAYVHIRRDLVLGVPEGAIRIAALLVAVIYNYTEASFWKVGLLWFVTVFALMEGRLQWLPQQAVSGETMWQSAVEAERV